MDLSKWGLFALKVPSLIGGIVSVVQQVKGAKGPEKKQAVIDAIPKSVELLEFGVGRDVLNDAAIVKLVDAAIEAEVAAMKARDALRMGILAKAPAQ